MDTCPNCQKPLNHVEGRRKKVYCSAACRNAFWRKTATKEPKYVLWKTYKELEEKYNALKKEDKIDYHPTTEQSYDAPPMAAIMHDESPQWVSSTPVLSYQELLRLAPEQDTREKREEFLKEVTRNRKLSDAQKRAIHAKFPKPTL